MNKMVQYILRVSSKLAVAALVVAGTFGSAHAQTVINSSIWKIDAGTKSWFANDNNTRGFAYNPASGNLLVVSRTGGLKVVVVNASTGDSVGVLDVTGITGGTFALSLIDVTPTGRIFAANLTTNAVADALKIYTWENEAAAPVVAYSGDVNASALRYGDSFRLDWTDGARNVYVGGSNNPNLAKFTWADGALSVTSLFNFGAVGNTTMRAVRGMAPIVGEDSLWINEFAYTVKKISTVTGAIGTVIAAKPTGTFDILKESLWIDYADINGNKLFAAFPGSLVAAGQSASLVDATTNTELAYTAAGSNGNGNASGGPLFDVANKRMYLLATNNHIAAYDISAFTQPRVNVTFTVNTASIRDTVKTTDLVQIRGVVNGAEQANYFGQTINWGSTSVRLNSAGGDYWTRTLTLRPGDVLTYKIYTAKPGAEPGTMVDHSTGGWESDAPGGGNYTYTVPANATGDITVPMFFYNRVIPFESKPDSIGIWFRVNVGAQFATGDVNNDSKVGVRGTPDILRNPDNWSSTTTYLTREPLIEGNRNVFYSGVHFVPATLAGTNFIYKYVIENGTNTTWEDVSDRPGRVGQADSTFRYGFFSGRRPPSRPIVQASLQFAVNVGVLEELGIFNRAKGDRVFVPGGFNGWDTAADGPGAATYNETFDTWTRAFNITEEVGAKVAYKYFVRWAPGRFDSASPDYIENLTVGAGWEEPGIAGGGNRIYTYTADAVQAVTDADGVAYFNGVPPFGVIRETISGNLEMPVTFTIDMTAALTHSTPFIPGTDSVFLAIQTPVWALTQGIPSNNDAFATNAATRDRILFKRVGNTNVYELVYNMRLPADNHIGFAIAYRGPNTALVVNSEGFDAGRRYYRYITPTDARDRENVIWPDAYELAPLTWKANQLDFETPPTYTGVSIDRDGTDTAKEFVLAQNYPNPFNPSTSIAFNLPVSSDVTLSVYNVLGQKVATLVNGPMTAGTHSVAFDASRLASGIYIYELRAGSFVQQRRMTLVK